MLLTLNWFCFDNARSSGSVDALTSLFLRRSFNNYFFSLYIGSLLFNANDY